MYRIQAENTAELLGTPFKRDLSVADDGTLAVEGDREKRFFATAERIAESSAILGKAGSSFELVPGAPQPLRSSKNKLLSAFEVVGKNLQDGTKGADLSGPSNCNEIAGRVVGPEQLSTMNGTGLERVESTPVGLEMAEYLRAYTSANLKRGTKGSAAVAERREKNRRLAQKENKEPITQMTVVPGDAVAEELELERQELQPSNSLKKALTHDSMKFAATSRIQGNYLMRVLDRERAEELMGGLIERGLAASYSMAEEEIVASHGDEEGIDALDESSEKEFRALARKKHARAARRLGLDEHASPDIGQAFAIFPVAKGEAGTFPYHWAGVVARAGGDAVTLENYAGRQMDEPYFHLYGPLTETTVAEGELRREKTSKEARKSTTFHGYWSSRDFRGKPTVTATYGKAFR